MKTSSISVMNAASNFIHIVSMNGCSDGTRALYVGSELGMEARKRVVTTVKTAKNSLWKHHMGSESLVTEGNSDMIGD